MKDTAVYIGINKKERILVLNELTANMAVFLYKYLYLFAVSFIHIPPYLVKCFSTSFKDF